MWHDSTFLRLPGLPLYAYPSNMTLVSIVPIQVLAVNQFEYIFSNLHQYSSVVFGEHEGFRSADSVFWAQHVPLTVNFSSHRLILKLFGYGDSTVP
jgi:hypothetical protein